VVPKPSHGVGKGFDQSIRRFKMYERIEELPDTVRDVLPEQAQEVYLEAFKASWESYDEEKSSEMSQEAVANRDAWSAVKREYTRDDETGKWYPAGEVPEHEEGEEEGGILDALEDVV
jgi:cation transport regulator